MPRPAAGLRLQMLDRAGARKANGLARRVFTTPYCSIDLRVGGVCRLCMRSPEGKDFWSKGVFREIIEPHLIVCTDTFSDEKGNIVSPKAIRDG